MHVRVYIQLISGMTDNRHRGKWHEIKGAVQQKWGKVTEDDIETMKGSYEELQGMLQKRYGYEKDVSKKQIDQFLKDNDLND